MLTDEEKMKAAWDCTALPEVLTEKTILAFATMVERAALAKAGEQEPVASKECGRWAGLESIHEMPNGSRLYVNPLPAQAVPERWRLTGCGQIKLGDVISMVMAGRRICTSAKEILNAGTDKEEIVYNRKKNHYFITSMVLDGTSNHKDVFIIPAGSLSASPKP